MSVLVSLEEINTDEDGPAIVFHCRTGKGRTTTAMAIGGLIVCHKKVSICHCSCFAQITGMFWSIQFYLCHESTISADGESLESFIKIFWLLAVLARQTPSCISCGASLCFSLCVQNRDFLMERNLVKKRECHCQTRATPKATMRYFCVQIIFVLFLLFAAKRICPHCCKDNAVLSFLLVLQVVQQLIRCIPNGQQVKREVDFILDQCSDTMTPMHYHIREVIFVTYNKVKTSLAFNELMRMPSVN